MFSELSNGQYRFTSYAITLDTLFRDDCNNLPYLASPTIPFHPPIPGRELPEIHVSFTQLLVHVRVVAFRNLTPYPSTPPHYHISEGTAKIDQFLY